MRQCFSQLSGKCKLLQRFGNIIPAHLQGIVLASISTGMFVCVGAIVRVLSERIDLFQILLFRQIVFILLLTPVIVKSLDILIKPKMKPLHAMRITGAFIALYFGFVTVSNIPFADATALGFTQVLFVAVISRMFLSESVGLLRILTIVVGFLGVMLVIQPSFDSTSIFYTLVGLSGAFGAAIAVVCVRRLAQSQSRVILLTYQAIFVGLIALVPGIYGWQWPTTYELLLLVSVGVISSIAQWIGVTAYKVTEANIVANVEYAKIIYSLIIGYYLFMEMPNILSLIGVSIIIASAMLPILCKSLSKKVNSETG
jgi:drug/metabolite transporter (DMT)-like permease